MNETTAFLYGFIVWLKIVRADELAVDLVLHLLSEKSYSHNMLKGQI